MIIFTVEYNFDDFFQISQILKKSANKTEREKVGFIKYTIQVMAQEFDKMFGDGRDSLIRGNKYVYRQWFETANTQERREYLVLRMDLPSGQPYVHCVYCLLFSDKKAAICNNGLRLDNPNYVTKEIKRHSDYAYHLAAIKKFNDIRYGIKNRNIAKVEENRYTVEKVIQAILFVATSGNNFSIV